MAYEPGSPVDERGAALVEFALVLPLLMLLLLGIFTTARAWNVHNTIDHAAREAARYGATSDPWNAATVRGVAQLELQAAGIDAAAISMCVEMGPNPCMADPSNLFPEDLVGITLTFPDYPLEFLFWTTDVDLSATAVARYE